MLTIKKILAPTDLSELSEDGVRMALEIAKSRGAEVTVYHVIDNEEARRHHGLFRDRSLAHLEANRIINLVEERKRLLATFLRDKFPDLLSDVKISQDVQVGVPYRKIIDRAAEEGADLIVMSTHGKSGLLHGLIGSVAEIVVRLASCPVVSVHPTKRRHEAGTQAA
jgi:nucleotide-binding universal stress UspA family protein